MRRSELYEKVWSTPITKLAAEFGISDVGLAKACRRHAVPVPPRGHWAKLKAGQTPVRTPLPTPELDVEVHFATSDPEERERQRVQEQQRMSLLKERAASVASLPPVVFATELADAHPLVKATQRYCDRLPILIERQKRGGLSAWRDTKPEDRPPREQHGRFDLFRHGMLNITASLASMDWILRFHATVLRALTDGGAVISWREAVQDRTSHRPVKPAVVMQFKGETLALRFSEGYRRVKLGAVDFAKRKKEFAWASEHETVPSGNFIFTVEGTEYQSSRNWQGAQAKLQGQVDDIVHTMFQLVALQPQLQKDREAREANARREAEARALEQRRRESRAEQLKKAFQLMEVDARVHQLNEFLAHLEQEACDLQPPFDERVKVWVGVVRAELSARSPADELLRECLSVPSWTTWPPAWWPQEGGSAVCDGDEASWLRPEGSWPGS